MAKYRNDGSVTRILEGCGPVPPGSWGKTVGYAYPVHADFTLIEDDDAPWVKLHAAAPPASLSNLAKYGQIIVKNNSGDSITVAVNSDSTNTLTLLDGDTYPIDDCKKEIGTMAITGSGTDPVYVWGLE